MARLATMLVGTAGAFMLFAQDALGMHKEGPVTQAPNSGGFQWDTFGLWAGIGVAIVLLVAWLAFEGRRHHWRPPHRPVTHH